MFAKRKCMKNGHDTDPDPGDFVLLCRRCGLMADLGQELDVRDYYFAGGATEDDLSWTGMYNWPDDTWDEDEDD